MEIKAMLAVTIFVDELEGLMLDDLTRQAKAATVGCFDAALYKCTRCLSERVSELWQELVRSN